MIIRRLEAIIFSFYFFALIFYLPIVFSPYKFRKEDAQRNSIEERTVRKISIILVKKINKNS
jgi:hypothetical protein